MNYLQMKKKAMLNYVSGSQPTETVQITTKSAGSSPVITVTYNGVSTDYGYATLHNIPIIVGCIILEYRADRGNLRWNVWALGNNVEVNGTPLASGHNFAWNYTETVDLEIVGTPLDTTNKTLSFVSYGTSNTTALMVIDNGVVTDQPYAVYLNKTVVYNLVDVTYTVADRWKFTANTPLKFNGATYQVGEVVDRINYMNDYDMRIFEPI